ncbi:MAG: 30S ribosomal protein S18 [Patescibacteria group bacterium]|nr:30S ribosomal protein S18 [Patescibacteria group bacterium]
MTCYFCSQNAKEIDFKEVDTIKRFLSVAYKIKPRKLSGICSKHQRKLARAVKRAKEMALIPYLPHVK